MKGFDVNENMELILWGMFDGSIVDVGWFIWVFLKWEMFCRCTDVLMGNFGPMIMLLNMNDDIFVCFVEDFCAFIIIAIKICNMIRSLIFWLLVVATKKLMMIGSCNMGTSDYTSGTFSCGSRLSIVVIKKKSGRALLEVVGTSFSVIS